MSESRAARSHCSGPSNSAFLRIAVEVRRGGLVSLGISSSLGPDASVGFAGCLLNAGSELSVSGRALAQHMQGPRFCPQHRLLSPNADSSTFPHPSLYLAAEPS